MLNVSAATVIGQTYKAYRRGGDLEARLLLGIIQVVLALILFPPILLGIVVAGVCAAGDWCALRIVAAIRGDPQLLHQPMWHRLGRPGVDQVAG